MRWRFLHKIHSGMLERTPNLNQMPKKLLVIPFISFIISLLTFFISKDSDRGMLSSIFEIFLMTFLLSVFIAINYFAITFLIKQITRWQKRKTDIKQNIWLCQSLNFDKVPHLTKFCKDFPGPAQIAAESLLYQKPFFAAENGDRRKPEWRDPKKAFGKITCSG